MSVPKTVTAGIVAILLVVLIGSMLLKAGLAEPPAMPAGTSPGTVLWDARSFETILQGLLILGGVFAILMLLKTSKKEAPG